MAVNLPIPSFGGRHKPPVPTDRLDAVDWALIGVIVLPEAWFLAWLFSVLVR